MGRPQSLDPSLRIIENNQFGSDPNRMPDMEIRGKSSVVNLRDEYEEDPNQPLFILDGFETTLAVIMDLSMDRVASVTILKDAASTAIYGSKAANGVVVVETVTPSEGKLRVSYNGSAIISFADLTDYNLMNAAEKLEFELLSGNFKSNNPVRQEMLEQRYNSLAQDVARGVDTYWLAEPLRTGVNHRHTVYVDGGSETMKYGIGFNYNQNNGVMKQSSRDILGGNIDFSYRVKKLIISNKLSYSYRETSDPIVGFSQFSRANPYYTMTNESGGYDKMLETSADFPSNSANVVKSAPEVSNPMWNYIQSSYLIDNYSSITNNTNIEYRPNEAISIRGRLGVTKSSTESEDFYAPEDTRFNDYQVERKGSYENSRNDNFNMNGDATITYGKLFNSIHQINAVAGASFSENRFEGKGYMAEGFPEGVIIPSFATQYVQGGKPSYNESMTRSASFFFNGGYSMDNRYLIDVNYRKDGASVFGVDKRFTDTWSVGLGWNIHREKFFTNLTETFSLFKLRGSIGNPGNQNFSSYVTATTYGFTQLMQNNFGAGLYINTFAYTDLDWQKTTNGTVGVDMVLLNNRLSINADYYYKYTDPVITNIEIPASTGVTTRPANLGIQVTYGFDASLRYNIIQNSAKRIHWSVGVNMRTSKSYYDEIGEELTKYNSGQLLNTLTRFYDGASTTALWAVVSAGIDPSTGKEIFIDSQGNYTFNFDNSYEQEIGDTNPTLDGVINTTFRYRNFSFNAAIRYSFGADTFNTTLYQKVENISPSQLNYNQDKRALYERWQEPGDMATYKGISLTQSTPISSRFVYENNYMSLESLSISYNIENSFTEKIGVRGLKFSAYTSELVRWSTVKYERGIDYPFARSISGSLSFFF